MNGSICVYRSSRHVDTGWEDDRPASGTHSGLIEKLQLITTRYLPKCRSIHEILRVYTRYKIDAPHFLQNPKQEVKEIVRFILLDSNGQEDRTLDRSSSGGRRCTGKHKSKGVDIMEGILFNHCGYGPELGLIPFFVEYKSRKEFYFQQFLVRVIRPDGRTTLIDQYGRCYKNVNDWRRNNKLPPASILFPKDGFLKMDESGQPILDQFKTPSTRALPKVLTLSDIAVGFGVVSLGVVAVVGTAGAALPSLFIGGQICATIYYAGRGLVTIVDKYKHKDKFSNSRKLHRFTRKNQVTKSCLIIEDDERDNNDSEIDRRRDCRESSTSQNDDSAYSSWASAGSCTRITRSATPMSIIELPDVQIEQSQFQPNECVSCQSQNGINGMGSRKASAGSLRSSKYFVQEVSLAPPAGSLTTFV